MRTIAFGLLLFAASCVGIFATEVGVEGSWITPVVARAGGPSLVVTFHPDGAFTQTARARSSIRMKGTWSRDRNQLSVTAVGLAADGVVSNPSTWKWRIESLSTETLVVRDEADQERIEFGRNQTQFVQLVDGPVVQVKVPAKE